jgi:hypothetical protein
MVLFPTHITPQRAKLYTCETGIAHNLHVPPKLHSSTLPLPSRNGYNSFITAQVEVIENVVPSSLVAAAADDRPHSDTDGVLTTLLAAALFPSHSGPSRTASSRCYQVRI